MSTLLTYQTDVLRIVHDTNLNFYTQADVYSAINEARRQLVADTSCLRSLQSLTISEGVEVYIYGTIAGYMINSGGQNYTAPTAVVTGGNATTQATLSLTTTNGVITGVTVLTPGAGYQPELAPIVVTITDATGSGANISVGAISINTIDILQVTIIWNTTRIALDWMAWTEFSTRMRSWTNWLQRPCVWAQYGESSIYLGPSPDQSYYCEVDSSVIPIDLVSTATVDPISLIYQGPIKYYAAYVLKQKEQSFNEADWFKKQYETRLFEISSQVMSRRVASMYGSGVL
jgi:hypothetical protein